MPEAKPTRSSPARAAAAQLDFVGKVEDQIPSKRTLALARPDLCLAALGLPERPAIPSGIRQVLGVA